jgi:hypothetical protein
LVRRAHLDRLVIPESATPVTNEHDPDINDIERLRMTPEQQQQSLAAIDRLVRRRQQLLARRNGQRFSSSLELLDEARAQRSRELA